MKKRFLSLLIAMSVMAMPTGVMASEGSNVKRLCGNDRYDTSISIAKEFIKNKNNIDSVILASGENFPDALSGTTLCNKYNAPLLLINNNAKAKILDFIYKNLPKGKTVYILGGEGVVNQSIYKEIQSKNYKVKRLAGKNRYETNNTIVNEMSVAKGTSIFVCNADSFADALSASPVAGSVGFPIVLVDRDYATKETMEQIKKINPTNIYFVGGSGVILESTVKEILKVSPNSKPIRIEGKDRYETSQQLNKAFNLDTEEEIAIADGRNYPDALSGASLASIKNIGIKLVNPDINNGEISKNVKLVDVLGGEGVVPNQLVSRIMGKKDIKVEEVKPAELKPAEKPQPVEVKPAELKPAKKPQPVEVKDTEKSQPIIHKSKIGEIVKLIQPDKTQPEKVQSVKEDKVQKNNILSNTEKSYNTINPVIKESTNKNGLTEEYKKAVCDRMVQLVNELRKSQGVAPLKAVDTLNKLAENRSIYMAQTGEFSHTDKSGKFIFQEDLDRTKYNYNAVGENIAQNFYDANSNTLAEKLFTQWKNSPGHYKNMIGSQFNEIGFGISMKSNGEVYATQGFVGR